ATHLERSRRLWAGQSLTEVTTHLCQALGVRVRVLPMTDDEVRTMVRTDEGELEYQEYFVHRQCGPKVSGFHFAGLESASPSRLVMESLDKADLVMICTSNPFVSLRPIIELPGVRERLQAKSTIAVAPIIGCQAVKGPAA